MTNQKQNLSSYRFTQPEVLKLLWVRQNPITLAEESHGFNYLLDKLSHISCSQWFILMLLNLICFGFIIMAYSCTKH